MCHLDYANVYDILIIYPVLKQELSEGDVSSVARLCEIELAMEACRYAPNFFHIIFPAI